MPAQADSTYNRRAWNQWLKGNRYGETPGFAPIDQSIGPFALNDDRVTAERMVAALANMPEPTQRPLFRPRFGYNMRAISITDVAQVDTVFRTPADANPGGPASIDGSSRNSYANTLGNV